MRGTTGISATYFVRQARHQLHLLWEKEVASASLTLWDRRGHQRHLLYEKGEASASLWETEEASASLTLWDRRGISVTYFVRQERHQRHLLCETGEASASLTLWNRRYISVTYFVRQERHQGHLLWEKEEVSASLTLWDRRVISVTYFGRQKKHQRHITVRLTFLTHSVRMRPNFQGLPWFEFDGLCEDELLIRFLLNRQSEESFVILFSITGR